MEKPEGPKAVKKWVYEMRMSDSVLLEYLLSENKNQEKIETKGQEVLDLIERFGLIDGSHHKQWILDQTVRILAGADYDEWVKRFDDQDCGEFCNNWDTGIAP